MIVTVTPNPGLDRTIEVPRLRPGELHRVRRATVEPGGKGINVARVLAAHGVATQAVFPAGSAEGEALVAMLAHDIESKLVTIATPLRVNVAIVEPGGQVTKFNEEGPELTASDSRSLLLAVREAARGAGWVVSCGSLPRGLAPDFHAEVVGAAHAEGAWAAVDTSGEALELALLAKPDLVKPNRDELEEAVGWSPIDTFGDAISAARELVVRGAGRVLASLGSAGALLVDRTSALYGIAPCNHVQSTVGAGDSLLAGFLAAGTSAQEALRQAVEWAAQSVSTRGNVVVARGRIAEGAAGIVTTAIDLSRRIDQGPLGIELPVSEIQERVDGVPDVVRNP
jgi:1-phosphofructokinase